MTGKSGNAYAEGFKAGERAGRLAARAEMEGLHSPAPATPMDTREGLEPCPFCGIALQSKRGQINPYARCVTPKCFGAKMPVVSLDVPADVGAWNTRALPSPELPAGGVAPAPQDPPKAIEFLEWLIGFTGAVRTHPLNAYGNKILRDKLEKVGAELGIYSEGTEASSVTSPHNGKPQS